MSIEKSQPGVIEKALQINLDQGIYGTIAEIGAGQEVARNFFIAGGASGTVAKTMSAYDMQVSDAIYGQEPDKRYVSLSRVEKMVDREFSLVVERLEKHRSQNTTYFAFADTIAAKSFLSERDCHGWMGIKFQDEPLADACKIILHVRMKDNSNFEQQQALGILGINLIYGAFYYKNTPETLIESLIDNLSKARIEIDMIKFSGPLFKHIDNRLMSLHLVKSGLTHSVFFTNNGEPIQANDLLHNKNILLLRGSFRPFTLLHQDMFNCVMEQTQNIETYDPASRIFLPELSMSHLLEFGDLDKSDFLGRIDTLNKIGFPVQISDFTHLYELKYHLKQFTVENISFALGLKNIIEIFNSEIYINISGNMIEGLGKLFSGNTRLYVYPKLMNDGKIINIDELQFNEDLRYLFKHFTTNNLIIALKNVNTTLLYIYGKKIREEMKSGDGPWKDMLPEKVYQIIKEQKLFGYQ